MPSRIWIRVPAADAVPAVDAVLARIEPAWITSARSFVRTKYQSVSDSHVMPVARKMSSVAAVIVATV